MSTTSTCFKTEWKKHDLLFDGPQAPLGTFSAKIEFAYRMGLWTEDIKKSLNIIRRIRNQFAHKIVECDFTDPKVLSLNKELHELNDVASEEKRSTFSEGSICDYEKSVSWLIYWIKHIIHKIPVGCPNCGATMEHRSRIKQLNPNDST